MDGRLDYCLKFELIKLKQTIVTSHVFLRTPNSNQEEEVKLIEKQSSSGPD